MRGETISLTVCLLVYVHVVMQKELDKIERYAIKIVEQAKMEKPACDKLLSDVKVKDMIVMRLSCLCYSTKIILVCTRLFPW